MIKRRFIRSIMFNFAFYIGTAICALICLPTLALPRKWFLGVVTFHTYLITFLEYTILGLKYEVRGREYLPEKPPYIIAAKHQSAYETFKLRSLFDDPAIILKQELLKIPLWGWFLKKSDVIAIDRSNRSSAFSSMEDGARRAAEAGRPIIVFPQGTRVMPDETAKKKPYKKGIYAMYMAVPDDCPVVPMAHNAGLFWPKKPFGGFFKSSGTVVFEFLLPIEKGLDKADFMKRLEQDIETKTNALIQEAIEQQSKKSRWWLLLWGSVLIAAFGAYVWHWDKTAREVKAQYVSSMARAGAENAPLPRIGGFPKMIMRVDQETFNTSNGKAKVNNLKVETWPLPYLPIYIYTEKVMLDVDGWHAPLELDSLEAKGRVDHDEIVTLEESFIRRGGFSIETSGTIDLKQKPIPKFDLMVVLDNHALLFEELKTLGVLDDRTATFAGASLNFMRRPEDGKVEFPVRQRGDSLYLGPFKILKIY